jgi:hypothetical protein
VTLLGAGGPNLRAGAAWLPASAPGFFPRLWPRPLGDPSGAATTTRGRRSKKKALENERADARTRTADPFITSEVLYQLSYVGSGCSGG